VDGRVSVDLFDDLTELCELIASGEIAGEFEGPGESGGGHAETSKPPRYRAMTRTDEPWALM
jgi:hypothetical protein